MRGIDWTPDGVVIFQQGEIVTPTVAVYYGIQNDCWLPKERMI